MDTKDDLNLMREIIMDHYQYPRNRHLFAENEPHFEKHMAQDSCIDDITVQAKIKDGIISEVVFDGIACTISTASTSIMTTLLKGKTKEEALAIIEMYQQMIDLKPYDADVLQEAIAFKNVGKQANRINCATIGWRAIKEIIFESEEE